MRARLASGAATKAATEAGRPALVPELLATVGARYSRSDDGLDAILAKVDATDPEKSIDRIFNMVDFGHDSLLDIAPVAIFMDEISIFAAYYIWSIVPTAGGQESSTRYIKMNVDGLVDPNMLGIAPDMQDEWKLQMAASFEQYEKALIDWEAAAKEDPSLTKIPQTMRDDPKKASAVARMERNYAFDRARVFLPVATATNMMLNTSARTWVSLVRHLLSHYLPEFNAIGAAIKEELALVTPRLLKHSVADSCYGDLIMDEFNDLVEQANYELTATPKPREGGSAVSAEPQPTVSVRKPNGYIPEGAYAKAMAHRKNRYSPIGKAVRRTTVVYGWSAVSLGEIRDMNRHRPGDKECPLVPQGFYAAEDQVPLTDHALMQTRIEASYFGGDNAIKSLEALASGDKTYIYWTMLGTQYSFEHTNQAHHYIYESELRTGTGAHYRYAKHYRDALQIFYKIIPELQPFIIEGAAEPE